MDLPSKLRGLDLFSGIGGLTIALAPWVQPVAYCEIEPYASAVLLSQIARGNIPAAPIWDDVRTLTGDMLPEIDIIYGGFPCQDISLAGTREGLEGKRSALFFEICRIAAELRPSFVMLENVAGVKEFVPRIRAEFEAIGFTCRDGFLSAAEVGANHKRMRWWLLAYSASSRWRQGRKNLGGGNERARAKKERSRSLHGGAICDTAEPRLSNGRSAEMGECGTDPQSQRSDWWKTEPGICRVVDGLPFRPHRIRALGNSVVPQQARRAFEILAGIGGGIA